jgi:hypothetical protein
MLRVCSRTARWKRGIISPLHEWPPTGGSHGKPHPTTKILSRARRRGNRLAACGARTAAGDVGDARAPSDAPHLLAAVRRGLKTQALSRVRTSRSNAALRLLCQVQQGRNGSVAKLQLQPYCRRRWIRKFHRPCSRSPTMLPALLDELVRLKPDVLIAGKGGEVTNSSQAIVSSRCSCNAGGTLS